MLRPVTTVEELERHTTLTTAVARYEELRLQEALADPTDPGANAAQPLSRAEALELLALGEVIIRKASYGRQLTVRSARAAGASWAQIGQALAATRQSAWEAHSRWIDSQARQHEVTGHEGLNPAQLEQARALAAPAT